MPLDHKPPKVVTTKGQKRVRCRTSGNKAQITVIACVSASGHAIPPFAAKRLNTEWTNGEVLGMVPLNYNFISTYMAPHGFSHVKCQNFSCKSLFT